MIGLRNLALHADLAGEWVDPDGRRWVALRFDRRGRVVLRDGDEFTVRWPTELRAWARQRPEGRPR